MEYKEQTTQHYVNSQYQDTKICRKKVEFFLELHRSKQGIFTMRLLNAETGNHVVDFDLGECPVSFKFGLFLKKTNEVLSQLSGFLYFLKIQSQKVKLAQFTCDRSIQDILDIKQEKVFVALTASLDIKILERERHYLVQLKQISLGQILGFNLRITSNTERNGEFFLWGGSSVFFARITTEFDLVTLPESYKLKFKQKFVTIEDTIELKQSKTLIMSARVNQLCVFLFSRKIKQMIKVLAFDLLIQQGSFIFPNKIIDISGSIKLVLAALLDLKGVIIVWNFSAFEIQIESMANLALSPNSAILWNNHKQGTDYYSLLPKAIQGAKSFKSFTDIHIFKFA